MTRPTDEELERMAVRLETRIIQSTMIAEAAAMLRAMKGQGNQREQYCARCGAPKSNHPYRHPFVAGGIAALDPAPDQPSRCAECDCENGGADCNWIAQPAPDHCDWNDAIEAAVVIATDWTLGPEEIAPAIRALKKGPPQ